MAQGMAAEPKGSDAARQIASGENACERTKWEGADYYLLGRFY